MSNNSQGKKQEVEDHRRNFKFSNNKTSVTACTDSLNAKTSHVTLSVVTCGKCVLNDNHDLCVLHYINGVSYRTRQPMAVPISPREPKHNVNQFVATSSKKTVATDSTIKKSRHITKKLYDAKLVRHAVGGILRNASRTANILEHKTPRCSTVSNTPLSSNSFAARTVKFGNDQIVPILGYGDLGNDLLTGSRGTYLYSITLQDSTTPNPICLMAKATSSQAWLWHRRLSHLNFDTINLLSKNNIVNGLPRLKFIKGYLEYSLELLPIVLKSSLYMLLIILINFNNITQLTLQSTHQTPTQVPSVTAPETIIQAETNTENAQFNKDEFINIFSTPVQEQGETSSCHVDSSNMHTFYQHHPSAQRWTKDHPLEQVIGNPSQSIRTRRQLEIDGEISKRYAQKEGIDFKSHLHQLLGWRPSGFSKGSIDPTLFITKHGEDILLVQIYVDDIIFGSTNPKLSKQFGKLMHSKFDMSMMGELKFFLGIQIHQSPRDIFINQAKYAQEILKKHGMTSCDSIGTPMATKHLDADLSGTPVYQTKYRSMVGALMYLTASRPDILHVM
ncbi:retrovirus-related pol polyprotein from transposon TNT 1-94 [Tanacetum coccineum]|uniref:Retrovirus-related pol polyprotein from transposon TNT 1-94 n=1 Tax=Tanacetum coccineum TaxID=301880 RepID=A0ABQ5GST7_9ASTR